MKLAYALLLIPIIATAGNMPNPELTPGAIDSRVTQQTIHKTVCIPGYTSTVRPSVNYTNKLKRKQIEQYQYVDKDMQNYEEDHLIPLAVGGHPSDPRNLWPEPYQGEFGARKKDVLELYAHRKLCKGEITLDQAQRLFTSDWRVGYRKIKTLD